MLCCFLGCCLGWGVCFVFVGMCLFCFMYMLVCIACMYCFCFVLCRCLYVILCMLVCWVCEGAGSFAGGWSSLAYIYISNISNESNHFWIPFKRPPCPPQKKTVCRPTRIPIVCSKSPVRLGVLFLGTHMSSHSKTTTGEV